MSLCRAALVAAALLSAAVPLAAQEANPSARRPTLAVTGEGVVTAAPDLARFSVGVVSAAKTAREALDGNTAAVAETIAVVKGAGVEARDIATAGFSVQPQYAAPKQGSNEPPRIVGYEVHNTVSVRLRELSKLGALLDEVVTRGANQIGGIDFDLAEPAKLEEEARVAAVKDARRQADLMAEAAGLRVVRVLTLAEETGGLSPMPRMMAAAPMAKRDSVPVEAGETEVRARVAAVFEIEPR